MNLDSFFEELQAISGQFRWHVKPETVAKVGGTTWSFPLVVRAYPGEPEHSIPAAHCYCPVTALVQAKTAVFWKPGQVDDAARTIGLEKAVCLQITAAADGTGTTEVRNKLLNAVGKGEYI